MILREGKALPAPLRPYIRAIWYTGYAKSGYAGSGHARSHAYGASASITRERVLPTATMSLAFRLTDEPLRLFDSVAEPRGHTVGHAVVGGVRSRYYVRDISGSISSVGAQLNPGAAAAMLGVPAGALAERHTRLDDLWGPLAEQIRERLALAGTPECTLALFESMLIARLATRHAARATDALHPVIVHALARIPTAHDIDSVVAETGYSHRRFIALFRNAVGLTPKLYSRIVRFQAAIDRLAVPGERAGARIATDSGFSDQSHWIREFGTFAGVTPGAYARIAPVHKNHVPIVPPRR